MTLELESQTKRESLDYNIKAQISSIYKELQTNISDVDNLTERRHRLVIELGGLFEQRIKLGTLINEETNEKIKIHQVCIALFNDMKKNQVPMYCYSRIAQILPKKYKKPYEFHKLENDRDKDGKLTGLNAEVTTLVNPDKHTLVRQKVKIPDIEDYSVDGTPRKISQMEYDDSFDNIKKVTKQTRNLSELSPDMIPALFLSVKVAADNLKKYCNTYNIKIPGEKKPSQSSVSLNLEKPPYRKGMIGDEIRLLEKDFATMRKQVGHMILTQEEEYFFWETIRALRLFIRPHVNEKYRRDWYGYQKILKILENKNMSGVAKNDTLGAAKIYDPEQKKYVYIHDIIEDTGLEGAVKLKGISRNHLRNMTKKLNGVFADIMLDLPFLQDFSSLFEDKIQPLRDGKAVIISDRRS